MTNGNFHWVHLVVIASAKYAEFKRILNWAEVFLEDINEQPLPDVPDLNGAEKPNKESTSTSE